MIDISDKRQSVEIQSKQNISTKQVKPHKRLIHLLKYLNFGLQLEDET
jgi:hypothetical protein